MNALPALSVIATASVRPAAEPLWDRDVPPAQKRRNPRVWQLASAAVERLMRKTSEKPRSIVVATALGALDETRAFIDGVLTSNAGAPRNFIASVHNSMAGKLALDGGINGPNITVCDGHNSFASAIVAAGLLRPEDLPVLIVAVEENLELLGKLRPHLSAECRRGLGDLESEGAAAFLCAADRTGLPTIAAVGPVPCADADAERACAEGAARSIGGPCTLVAISESSDFFLKPALIAESILASGTQSTAKAIGAFSPSARAFSLVFVCA